MSEEKNNSGVNPIRKDGADEFSAEVPIKTTTGSFRLMIKNMTNYRLNPERYFPKSHDSLPKKEKEDL